MSRSILFVSPHSKKIGESYVLPRLVKHAVERNLSTKFMLFNVCGEWDDLKDKYGSYIIDNPASKIVGIAPDIESINPWLNYRVWLFFVSISIFVGLPLALRKRKNIIVVARMATSAVAMARVLSNRKIRFMASMAGVPLPSAFRRRSWPLLYRNYDRVVVPCSDMIPRLTKLCNKSETLFDVIPNAVLSEDQIAMGPTFDTAPPTDNSPFKIVAVGRLTRQKGVDLLLRSLVNLPFSVHLNLIGDGEDERKLRDLADELNLSSNVTFSGRLEEPWLTAADSHLFIMPSRWEGPGHTIIEALAIGMPSIVSNCPFGPEESVEYGSYGIVVQYDSEEALSEGICKAYQTYEDLKNRAMQGAKFSCMYTAPHVSSKWIEAVSKI